MDDREGPRISKEFLLESFDDIVADLRAVGHPSRLRVLILLSDGTMDFGELLDEMDLKKSALANHIIHLVGRGMVEKVHHGTYALTEDGRLHLRALERAHRDSEALQRRRREASRREELARSFLDRR